MNAAGGLITVANMGPGDLFTYAGAELEVDDVEATAAGVLITTTDGRTFIAEYNAARRVRRPAPTKPTVSK